MKYLLGFFLVVSSLSPIAAQSENTGLRGRVSDDQQAPVAFANVTLFSLPDSVMRKAGYSEDDGSYLFTHISPGRYYINISFVGFDTYLTEPVEVKSNEITVVPPIRLAAFATELNEVVVTSTRPVVEVKPDKTVFNVEGSVNSIGNTALDLLRKAPGVVVDNNERLMLIGKSGVRVYIDGKQSLLRGDDLANYLKTLQSNQIDAIEIITQPSSRYEADGNAGIINIRLIKDKSLGTNATLSLNHNQAVHSRSNANLNINNRTRALNLFGNINYAIGGNSNWQQFMRTTEYSHINQDNKGIDEWHNGSLRAGADLTLGEHSTVGVLFDGAVNDHDVRTRITSLVAPAAGEDPFQRLLGNNDVANTRDNYNVNANYRFDNRQGTVFNVDLDYGSFIRDGRSLQPNYYYDIPTGNLTDTRIFSALTPTTIDIRTFKLDYERPLLKGAFGAGVKLAIIDTDNDYQFYDIIDDNPVLNIDVSNRFTYQENINAAYVNYNRQWKKIGLQAGLRLEHTDSRGDLTSYKPEQDQTVTQDYLNLFPSGGITYQLHAKHMLRLTYSRRIDRPNYQDLNPFEFKLDELTFQRGNPFLRPQFSNSLQLGHTFNHTLNTTLTYTHTNDLMAQLTDTASMGAAFITTANIAQQDVYSLSVSYPFTLVKGWNVFANSSVTHSHNEADFGSGKVVDIRATMFNIYMQHSYVLSKKMTVELSGWYNSPGIWGGNFASDAMWSVDAGLQMKVMQNRGTVKVAVSDIFKTQEWGGSNEFGGLAMRAMGGWESRQLKMNFTYLLGNKDVKGSRRRTTGLEDESKRVQR